MHAHTHTYTHPHTHIYTHTNAHTHTHTQSHTQTHTHTHKHTRTHILITQIQKRTYTHTHTNREVISLSGEHTLNEIKKQSHKTHSYIYNKTKYFNTSNHFVIELRKKARTVL